MKTRKNDSQKPPPGGNKKGKMWKKIRTTHIAHEKKSVTIAFPAIINGKRCLAYVKNGNIMSYVTIEEAMKIIMRDDIPKITVDF